MTWSPIDKGQAVAKWCNRINEVASNHTQVTGVLAGFSITVVILIAGIKLSGDSASLHTQEIYSKATFGLFIAAFFGYVSTGIMYSISIERECEHQYYLFSVASLLYYLSVVLSFAAIVPLTAMLNYSEIRLGAIVAMLSAVLGGYIAAVAPIHDLLRVKTFVLLIAFATSLFFGALLLLSVHIWPGNFSVLQLLSFSLPVTILTVGAAFMISLLTFFDAHFATEKKFISYLSISLVAVTSLVGFYAFLVLML